MKVGILLCLLFGLHAYAQHGLDYFISQAVDNSPVLLESRNLQAANQIQKHLYIAENSSFQLTLSGDYLFSPYFNNNGNLVSTNPSAQAIGYDIGVTNGGLYSAQVNLERNIFNRRLRTTLDRQIRINDDSFQYNYKLEKHNLEKQVIDHYLNAYQFLLLSRLSSEAADNLSQQLKLSAELVEKGYAKSQDYLLLKIEMQSQTIARNDARQQYRSNLYDLYAVCGIDDTTVVDIEATELIPGKANPLSTFIDKYHLDSLTLINELEIFNSKYRPQVKLFANTGLNAVELNNIQRKFGISAGVNISLPILDGGQKRLNRQQNHIARSTVTAYRVFAKNNIHMQRKNLQARIQSLGQNIRALTEQINDYRELLEISARQLRQGNISMIDYLTLLRNFIDLRKNSIDMAINHQLEINNYNYWNW